MFRHPFSFTNTVFTMLTIYAIPVSLYCAKLRILLRHKQLQWREVPPPGGYGSKEFKQIIPSGNLPALVDGDLILADTEAIAEYLNELHPTPPMLPADIIQRAKTRELSRFHDTRLEPELRALFPHIKPENRNLEVAKKQSLNISSRLEQLASMLGDKNIGNNDTLSLADCGFTISFEWIDALTPTLDLDISWPDPVISYRNHLRQHPAIAAELADYQPKIQNFLRAPGHHEA